MQNILNLLNEKLFNSIIPGQSVVILNENYDSQLNKVSSNNPQDIAVDNSDRKKFNVKNYKRIRRLQNQGDCDESKVICLEKDKITGIMNNSKGASLGFNSQFNKNKNIPIQTNSTRAIFSETSLDYGISVGDKEDKHRRLQLDELTIYFEIRLKVPNIGNNTDSVAETTCVQYDKNKVPDISCLSWYDPLTNEVVCQCNKQGLTVNVMDKGLSNASKLAQFPSITIAICKNKF